MEKVVLSVHGLVDFLLRRGSIDTRIYNNASMAEGSRIHLRYQQIQSGDYLSEQDLSCSYVIDNYEFVLSGRADGIILSKKYPFGEGEDKLYFKTKIFHPNIREEDGLLSILNYLDIFAPSMTIGSIAISIQSILDEPNPETFLNERAAKLYKEDRNKYEKTVKEYTAKYANFLNFENELSKYQLNIKHIEK